MRLRIEVLVNLLAASPITTNRVRILLMRLAGMDIHPSCRIRPGLVVRRGGSVTIGANTHVNSNFSIHGLGPVTIEDNVALGAEVSLVTSTHEVGGPEFRAGKPKHGSVVIRHGAWLGARVTVLPFVTIGEGAIVGAGAVVLKDVPPHTAVAGVPARPVRDLAAYGAREGRPAGRA